MRFAALPDRRATDDPHGPAVADPQRALTNAELLAAVRAAACHLRELGVGPGDVVALRLTNRVEFVVLLFAAWRIGATVTPINPALTPGEVARQVEDSGTGLLVVEDGTEPVAGITTLEVGGLRTVVDGPDIEPHEIEPQIDPDALALLIYTSGSTGAPKGVLLDHANLDAMAAMGRQALEIGPTDRCLLILPLFHVNGIVVSVLLPLLANASVVIAGRFVPRTFFDLVEAQRPTYFSAVPTIFGMLAALPPEITPDTSSVRFAVCGAAPSSAELLERVEGRYGFPIIEGYGLSEATCGSTINPLHGPRRAGTVGRAFRGQRIRILAADGTEAPTGTDGEVTLAGANVMRGYLGRAEETARVLVDGWLRTGDVGHLDTEGYLTLVGRSKDMIIRGGENISPKEIEDVLTADPTVQEAAVVGIPDRTWGEVVVAYVQPAPLASIDVSVLARRCTRNLSRYKRPVSIHVLDSLPTNAVGKIDKAVLRTRSAEGAPS